jgi:hypothetical protein
MVIPSWQFYSNETRKRVISAERSTHTKRQFAAASTAMSTIDQICEQYGTATRIILGYKEMCGLAPKDGMVFNKIY